MHDVGFDSAYSNKWFSTIKIKISNEILNGGDPPADSPTGTL